MGRNTHCTPEERAQIQILKKQNKSQREIASFLNCSKKMVQNALKKKPTKESRGRKRKTSQKLDRRIGHESKRNPFKSSKNIKIDLDLNVSARTVRRRLQEQSLNGRIARKVPMLSKKNIKKRIDFANNHVNWIGDEGSNKWRHILWTDETRINLFGSDGRNYVRRPPNTEFMSQYTKKTVKHGGGRIMIWGSFSWYGVGPIYWIKQNMDQHEYCNIMEKIMLPYATEQMPVGWILQQDNDPKHTSKKAKQFFEDNNISVLEWPAQSPDLNPIENLWSELKASVGQYKISNKDQLWDVVQREWAAICVEKCQRLIDSMPRRCEAVKKSRGYATRY